MTYQVKVWNIIKSLQLDHGVDIYKETADEDPNTLPDNYIVYITDVINTSLANADGKPLIRTSNCEVAVFTKGNANSSTNKQYVDLVEEQLVLKGINYNKLNLGFNSDTGRSQVTFEFNLI